MCDIYRFKMSETVTITKDLVDAQENKAPVENKNDPSFEEDGRIYEYMSASNPNLPPVPILHHPPELHQSGMLST